MQTGRAEGSELSSEPIFEAGGEDEGAEILEDDATGGAAAGLSVEVEPPASESAFVRNIADEDEVDASLSAAVVEASVAAGPGEIEWEEELSPQRLYLELKRIEDEVKELLEARDPVRKRKLGGTRRWRDLEDEIIAWKYGDRFDETTLRRVQGLIARRHHLYGRLRFLAATRPTWNS